MFWGSEIQKKKPHRKDAGVEHGSLHNAVSSTATLGKRSGHYVEVPNNFLYFLYSTWVPKIPFYSKTNHTQLRCSPSYKKKNSMKIRTEAMLNIFCRSECSLTSLRDVSFADDW